MRTGALVLLFLLHALSSCRAAPHRRGWGSKLDLREKAVQQFLKHNKASEEISEQGSGIYHNEYRAFDDSEPGDSDDETEEKEPRLKAKGRSGCVHPKTQQTIEIGSFDFDEKSCMMCECPSGKLKCYKTC